jgi:hypothetical protein
MAYNASRGSSDKIDRNVVAAQRINSPVPSRALYRTIYYSACYVGHAAHCDVGNKTSTKREPS